MLRKLAKKGHSAVLTLLGFKKFCPDCGMGFEVAGGGFVSPIKQQSDVELFALVATNYERVNDVLDRAQT